MAKIDVFSVRDLRNNASNLIKESEKGNLALITKHGRPVVMAIPFDEKLLKLGINKSLALHLYEKKLLTLSQAARLSSLSLASFLDMLKQTNINVIDYPPDEIDSDLENIQ